MHSQPCSQFVSLHSNRTDRRKGISLSEKFGSFTDSTIGRMYTVSERKRTQGSRRIEPLYSRLYLFHTFEKKF